jgi:hypothetical protein
MDATLVVALEAADQEEPISAWWWLWDHFDFSVQAAFIEEATARGLSPGWKRMTDDRPRAAGARSWAIGAAEYNSI